MSFEETLVADPVEDAEVVEAPLPAAQSGPVVRSGLDRRNFSWRTIIYSLVRPRRKLVNRTEDKTNHQVDFHPLSTPLLCVGIIALTAIDTTMTLYFYDVGVSQFNSVVTSIIEAGRGVYVAAKLIGTSLCVLLLATTSRIRVFGRLQAHHFLFFVFFVYLAATLNMLRYFL